MRVSKIVKIENYLSVVLGFRREFDENCGLLGC